MDILVNKIDSSIIFMYDFGGNKFDHTLELPQDCSPTDDSLFRIAFLSRPQNAHEYNIRGISAEHSSVSFFESQHKCKINVIDGETSDENEEAIRTLSLADINLSFSGGFDSIASLSATGKTTKLISHDFGGVFAREALFFKKFDGAVFKWHLRGNRHDQHLKFNESIDWRFMLAPLLCYKEKKKPYVISTGTILESSPFWFCSRKRPDSVAYKHCGFENSEYGNFGFGPNVAIINPVSAVSEYSTAKLAADYLDTDMLSESLESLADKGTLKRYRKEILVSLVTGAEVRACDIKTPKHIFGRGFTDDILTMYLVWKLGHNWVKKNYCENIPFYSSYIDMSFFEKVNTFNLETFDSKMKIELLNFFKTKGLVPFESGDAERLETSIKFRNDFLSGIK